MSLINEALKRTRDQSFQTGRKTPDPNAPYRLGDRPPVNSLRTTVIVVALVGCVVAAGLVVLLRPQPPPPPKPAVPPVTVVPAPSPVPLEVPSEVAVRLSEPVPPPPPEPEPPPFTLQGFSRDAAGVEAMINGYSVRVGDGVDGARVVAIENRVVRLKFGRRDIVLQMP